MKKVFGLLAVIVTVFILSGCKGATKIEELAGDEMFSQEGNYYIFFYQDDCEDCDSVKPIIEAYLEILKKEAKYEHKSTVYGVNLSKSENKSILRTYKGEGGQGSTGTFFVNGVENWKEMYIASTSSLISVKTNSQGVTFADFEAEGAQEVASFLATYLEN